MKTNFTHVFIIRIILFILICLYSFLVFGQPGYDFQRAIHKGGTVLQVNTKYHFNNVSPDIHTNVIKEAVTCSQTFSTITTGSGFTKTFQPTLNITGHANDYDEKLQHGEKNTPINDSAKLPSGNYITGIHTAEKNK